MSFPALLLRCLLVLALVAGGLPTTGMAAAADTGPQATATTSCHESEAPGTAAAESAKVKSPCCGGSDCLCDCLQHMPAAALDVPTLAAPVFASAAPGQRSFERVTRIRSATLRPPIG